MYCKNVTDGNFLGTVDDTVQQKIMWQIFKILYDLDILLPNRYSPQNMETVEHKVV